LVLLVVSTTADAFAEANLQSSAQAQELCLFSEPVDEMTGEDVSRATGILGTSDFMVSVSRRSYSGTRTQLLLETYTVRLQPGTYSLEVDERFGLVVVPDPAEFMVTDGLYLSIGRAIHLDCGIEASDEVSLAAAAQLLGLELEVQWVSASDPSRPFCSGEADHLTLSGELLRASLVHLGTDEVVCSMQTSLAEERDVRLKDLVGAHDGGEPQVEVTRIDLLDESPTDDAEPHLQSRLKYELESMILPCYQAALCRSGRRQGALSIRATLETSGQLRAAVVSVDALDSELISGCALNKIETIQIEGVETERDLGFVVMFRYQNGSSPNLATSLVAAVGLRTGAAGAVVLGWPKALVAPKRLKNP